MADKKGSWSSGYDYSVFSRFFDGKIDGFLSEKNVIA